jgi:hypothetical protein
MPLIDRLKSALERVEHEGEGALAPAEADIMAFADRLKKHATQYPEPVFAVLRRVKPVLVAKGFALVTRYEDVQEVLSRDDRRTWAPWVRHAGGRHPAAALRPRTPS